MINFCIDLGVENQPKVHQKSIKEALASKVQAAKDAVRAEKESAAAKDASMEAKTPKIDLVQGDALAAVEEDKKRLEQQVAQLKAALAMEQARKIPAGDSADESAPAATDAAAAAASNTSAEAEEKARKEAWQRYHLNARCSGLKSRRGQRGMS